MSHYTLGPQGIPNWSDVPEGYDWVAQDSDGKWFAYTHKPMLPGKRDGRFQWLTDSSIGEKWKRLNEHYLVLIPNPCWRGTLEKRPEGFGKSILESGYYNRFAKKPEGEFMCLMCPGNCPLTKNLTPIERIKGKKEQLTEQINILDKRIADLDDIVVSVNWKNATAEIKNKAVQAADRV